MCLFAEDVFLRPDRHRNKKVFKKYEVTFNKTYINMKEAVSLKHAVCLKLSNLIKIP